MKPPFPQGLRHTAGARERGGARGRQSGSAARGARRSGERGLGIEAECGAARRASSSRPRCLPRRHAVEGPRGAKNRNRNTAPRHAEGAAHRSGPAKGEKRGGRGGGGGGWASCSRPLAERRPPPRGALADPFSFSLRRRPRASAPRERRASRGPKAAKRGCCSHSPPSRHGLARTAAARGSKRAPHAGRLCKLITVLAVGPGVPSAPGRVPARCASTGPRGACAPAAADALGRAPRALFFLHSLFFFPPPPTTGARPRLSQPRRWGEARPGSAGFEKGRATSTPFFLPSRVQGAKGSRPREGGQVTPSKGSGRRVSRRLRAGTWPPFPPLGPPRRNVSLYGIPPPSLNLPPQLGGTRHG